MNYTRVALISDLHLSPAWPGLTDVLLRFLATRAGEAQAVFLLGDVFEAWVGDDDDAPWLGTVARGLRELAASGTDVWFMHGNRDFLLGQAFAARCGMRLLDDPTLAVLGGVPTLLSHGDALCTDETEYQAFRTLSRTPQWQAQVLARPLAERRELARQMRGASMQEHQRRAGAGEAPGDVADEAVRQVLRDTGAARLIHGHTHRPGVHEVPLPGRTAERIVLADWRDGQGEALWIGAEGSWARETLR
ncbi:MAG TPA: UDP-2,3-diacylglucosamine diphosphatase [Frateuria sp.]|uniref:UDP-2,3-diacylglucosamine diphosphatase n=1 Tax=Frateuria sp. TaxID=2211372 RepID=UPI002D7E9D7A|nr:UDP-2,3-diacylglucosamine diphosphatase [Frateuria sp.]HET6807107.1 UDP-2,3-diacylglucosamine diphosphatase [Frateuria sp.]